MGNERTTGQGEAVTILVMEHDSTLREMLQVILELDGYRVLAAGSATEALIAWRQSQDGVRVLVTDVDRPDAPGSAVADEASHLWPGLPLLFLASGAQEVPLPVADGGAPRMLLSKPFSVDGLRRHVRNLVAA